VQIFVLHKTGLLYLSFAPVFSAHLVFALPQVQQKIFG
jgi:hypothetical protein